MQAGRVLRVSLIHEGGENRIRFIPRDINWQEELKEDNNNNNNNNVMATIVQDLNLIKA